MNDADASIQIQQMVRFIRQEAEEKANEISISSEEVSPYITSTLFWSRSLRIRDSVDNCVTILVCSFENMLTVVLHWSSDLKILCEIISEHEKMVLSLKPIGLLMWQEFNIEKLQLVEAEKKKIRQEYEKKEKQVDVRKKMWELFSLLYVSLICLILFLRSVPLWLINS